MRHRWPRNFRPVAAVAAAALLLTGCGSLAPDASAAADVATVFHVAVADGDGEAACAVLAPEAVAALEQDSGESCSQAVLEQDIPDGGAVVDRSAYGQVAQVVLAGDVVFLDAFGDSWRVSAAGCTTRASRPYHCSIEKG
jgi:hypothetical protein